MSGPEDTQPIIQRRPIGGTPLVRDYLADIDPARSFYAGRPDDLQSFKTKLSEVMRRFGVDERRRAAAALRPTSERARARLERFIHEGGAMVTTGQQAGLFTGPLFTIYKALTAARLAEALEAELGVIILPVFWVASEDHDWDEVNHAFVLRGDELARIDLTSDDRRAIAMSDRRVGEGIESTLGELRECVEGQPYAPLVLELVEGAYSRSATVADGFAATIRPLLSPFDVMMTDASHPVLKGASAEVLARAVADPESAEAALSARTEALSEAGYHGQVALLEGATNIFRHSEHVRERVYVSGDEVHGAESGWRATREEAVAAILADPGRFSPNVLLRPVVESAVFPTLAYIGGPGELAYFAQLNPLFELNGMQPPIAYPRAGFTLSTEQDEAGLRALGMDVAELARPRHELVETLARRKLPGEVSEAIERIGSDLADGYRLLIDAAMRIDPTLAGALGSIRNESLADVGKAERKILRRIKALEGDRVRQLDRVRVRLAPGGQPQERVLSIVGFLAAHGPELLRSIAGAIPVPWGGQQSARVG